MKPKSIIQFKTYQPPDQSNASKLFLRVTRVLQLECDVALKPDLDVVRSSGMRQNTRSGEIHTLLLKSRILDLTKDLFRVQ